tara:strand:+ start:8806 stop:9528 length:723 start_codon:yes stop_codon:yes gene_type:complete
MESIKRQNWKKSFLDEFYRVTIVDEPLIRHIVKGKLGACKEAADIKDATYKCIKDIERIVTSQLNATSDQKSKVKERRKKLTKFKRDRGYVKKYVLEATKSYCRKKQHYWGHGKNKADTDKAETHKERKAGKAARIHGEGDANQVDNWISSIVTSDLNMGSLQVDTIERLNKLFKKARLNEDKIKCFWDRFDGKTFPEMAEQDKDKSATSDKYRKRYKRLMIQLEEYSTEFRDILMGSYG